MELVGSISQSPQEVLLFLVALYESQLLCGTIRSERSQRGERKRPQRIQCCMAVWAYIYALHFERRAYGD